LASLAMFIVAGGRWLHVAAIGALCIVGLLVLTMMRPYLKDRLLTFINPAGDPLGSGYQVQQSLIAIGSGGVFGRGFGQSIQKFNFLPEPVGDSIFAVFAEEWGLVGSTLLILLYLFFAFRGLRIASRANTPFASLLATGIIVLIVSESFINIASMLALFPLSGTPLLFVSQGGTALLFTLAEVGIVLNISRFQKQLPA
jgi:cell division protein FtsW